MTITFNNDNQEIKGTFCCPNEQNNDIIVQSNIIIDNIKDGDVWGFLWRQHEYAIKFVFYDIKINDQAVADLNISLQVDLVDEVEKWECSQNKIDFTLGNTTPKNITYSIKVDCGNIDRRNINSISFSVTITATGSGLFNGEVNADRDVRLTHRFNCADCKKYYENLFQIDTHQDILFTEPVECDIATIDINDGNQANGNANFPVIAVNDIPQKQISLDGVNFQQIEQFRYTYRDEINNVGKYTLTYKTGPFLCFNNGIAVNRTIEVLDANNGLGVTIRYNENTVVPDANASIELGDIVMPPVGMEQDYTIVLRNTAQGTPPNFANLDYGLRINSVQITNNTDANDLGKIENWTNTNRRNDIENDFLIGRNIPAARVAFIHPRGTMEEFVIKLDSNHLGNIKVEDNKNYIDIRLGLAICYDIVKGEETEQGIVVKYDIIGRLFRRLPSVHYSIDFGTSAIVACKRQDGNINIIDLKTTKANLFDRLNNISREVEREVPEKDKDGNEIKDEQGNTKLIKVKSQEPIIDKDKTIDNSEPDDRLIASSMAKREGNPVNTDTVIDYEQHRNYIDYYNESYWFSPTSKLTHVDNHLPCLKNLVGIDEIGNVDVRGVITNAYKQLCKYFLSNEQIESLALTIPNAFNSAHKQQLENIIYDNIKTIAKPYTINDKKYSNLSFISESDSVLYSYIYNKIRGKEAKVGDEYIFVYDMGAGTLDITYAKCSYEYNNQHKVTCSSVEILGRSGINKAGNYIDYLLGEIIHDKLTDEDQQKKEEQQKKIKEAFTGSPELRKILKSYLRNSVKTSLNNDTKEKIPCEYYDDKNQPQILKLQDVEITGINKITIGDIINHKRFRNFVDDCTTSLLKDFRSVYGENDTLKVNTVVVSGRTVEINAIRGKIKKFFGENVSYCRIDGRDFDGNNGNNNNNNGRTLKTAVAEGALAYMDYEQNKRENQPIYGHYGIIYQSPDGNKSIYGTTGNNPNLRGGVLAGFYRNNDFVGTQGNNGDIVINKNIVVGDNNSKLLLYHSYYNIETISKDIDSNRNKISILSDSGELLSGNYNIRLTIHADHTLQYDTDFGNAANLQVHADLNSDTLRKSIWPCSI